MQKTIKFLIHCKPQGQARPVTVRKSGRVWTFSPKNDFFNEVKKTILTSFNKMNTNGLKLPLVGGVYVNAIFYMPRPKNIPIGQISHIKKPDADNMFKALTDAINETGKFWIDDSQICKIKISKRYTINDVVGCFVEIGEVENEKEEHKDKRNKVGEI